MKLYLGVLWTTLIACAVIFFLCLGRVNGVPAGAWNWYGAGIFASVGVMIQCIARLWSIR